LQRARAVRRSPFSPTGEYLSLRSQTARDLLTFFRMRMRLWQRARRASRPVFSFVASRKPLETRLVVTVRRLLLRRARRASRPRPSPDRRRFCRCQDFCRFAPNRLNIFFKRWSLWPCNNAIRRASRPHRVIAKYMNRSEIIRHCLAGVPFRTLFA